MDLFANQNLVPSVSASPSWCHPNHLTAHNRFRQIFRDHWEPWCYYRMEREVPADQRAYLQKTVQRLMFCRDPDGGYARYLCPGCNFEHRIPFSCKTRFSPSCGKVKVDNWVNDITKDMLEVPHLHITLTTDHSFRLFFRRDSQLLKELVQVGAQAVPEVISDLYPRMRIGLVYTVHTAGRDLGYKPHVHLVITKGGLVDGKWVEIEGVPGARLSAKWSNLLCDEGAVTSQAPSRIATFRFRFAAGDFQNLQ
jgi:Transposase zinc-binding domain/Putative transposase